MFLGRYCLEWQGGDYGLSLGGVSTRLSPILFHINISYKENFVITVYHLSFVYCRLLNNWYLLWFVDH